MYLNVRNKTVLLQKKNCFAKVTDTQYSIFNFLHHTYSTLHKAVNFKFKTQGSKILNLTNIQFNM